MYDFFFLFFLTFPIYPSGLFIIIVVKKITSGATFHFFSPCFFHFSCFRRQHPHTESNFRQPQMVTTAAGHHHAPPPITYLNKLNLKSLDVKKIYLYYYDTNDKKKKVESLLKYEYKSHVKIN